MKFNKTIIAIIILFLLGLTFCMKYRTIDLYENFDGKLGGKLGLNKCHNVLVKKDNKLHLINTRKSMVPGVNPIIFENLEEYVEFVEWQKHMNIKCPILYLQYTTDTQNNDLI